MGRGEWAVLRTDDGEARAAEQPDQLQLQPGCVLELVDEDGAVLLDLRSVRPHDDTILVEEIQRAVREPRRTDE